MKLSALERREILTFAASFETFADNPDVVRRFAEALRAWACPAPARARDERQLELAPSGSEPAHHSAHNKISTVADALFDGSSRTYDAAPTAPSSSSTDLNDQQEKKREHVRPFTDEELPDDFRAIYAAVVRERKVILPSADYLWGKWVEFLWAKDRTFAKRWNLKRAWRDWCENERPIAEAERASHRPDGASASPRPPESSPRPVVERVKAPRRDEEPVSAPRDEAVAICSALARGELHVARTLAGPPQRPPPEARAMSA